jgi:hypothetical protein
LHIFIDFIRAFMNQCSSSYSWYMSNNSKQMDDAVWLCLSLKIS